MIETIFNDHARRNDFSNMRSAVAANRVNDWTDAKRILEEGVAAFPDSGMLNYMLGVESG